MSQSLSSKPKLDDQTLRRETLRQRLEDFFVEVDPDFDEAALDELVHIGMTEGEEKINNDLIDKYGEGFLSEEEEEGSEEAPHFDFDDLKVRQELRIFYKKHDPAYLETGDQIDQVIDLMTQIGQEAVYNKLFEFYNERVEDVVRTHKQQELRASMRNGNKERAFDDLDKLRENLVKYYEKFDAEEVENIDDVIALGMDIGYEPLMESMKHLYGTSLDEYIESLNPPPKPEKISKLRQLVNSKKKLRQEPNIKKMPMQDRRMMPGGVINSMAFVGKASTRIDKRGTPMLINPPTLKRPDVPVPSPQMPPRVPPRRVEMDAPPPSPRLPSATPRLPRSSATNKPVTPPSPHFPTATPRMPARSERDKPVTPPRKNKTPPMLTLQEKKNDGEVRKAELINFYEKHDVAKLALIDKIMKVAKKIGRERLNTKLMNFYSANLDTYAHEVSLPAETYTQAFNQRLSGVVPYDDLDQLREDLHMFYEKYDPLKIKDLDQIMQLGKRMGRKQLVAKLEQIYEVNVDVFCGRRRTQPMTQGNPANFRSQPPPMPRIEEYDVPPPPYEEVESDDPPPFPSLNVRQSKKPFGVSPLPTLPNEYASGPPPGQGMQRIRAQGVPVIPGTVGQFKFKKTGIDPTKDLGRKGRKKKKVIYSMYKLPKKKMRNTSASVKLLSVNLSSNGGAQLEGGGDLRDVAAGRSRKMKTKVDVADLMV